MTRPTNRYASLGLVAVIAACLALSACGRKGPPEAPVTTSPDAATVEQA